MKPWGQRKPEEKNFFFLSFSNNEDVINSFCEKEPLKLSKKNTWGKRFSFVSCVGGKKKKYKDGNLVYPLQNLIGSLPWYRFWKMQLGFNLEGILVF